MLLVVKFTQTSLFCHLCVMYGDSGIGNGNPIGKVQCSIQATYQKVIREDVSWPTYIHALYIPRIQNLVNVTIKSEISYKIQNIQHKNVTISQKNIQMLHQTHYM